MMFSPFTAPTKEGRPRPTSIQEELDYYFDDEKLVIDTIDNYTSDWEPMNVTDYGFYGMMHTHCLKCNYYTIYRDGNCTRCGGVMALPKHPTTGEILEYEPSMEDLVVNK